MAGLCGPSPRRVARIQARTCPTSTPPAATSCRTAEWSGSARYGTFLDKDGQPDLDSRGDDYQWPTLEEMLAEADARMERTDS